MHRHAFRLSIATLVGLLALVAVAPVASAAPSGADRLLAAGAGQHFSPAVGTSTYQAQACFTDDGDDVVSNESGDALDEPRADITDFCVDYGDTGVTLSVTLAEATDPQQDPNWNNTVLGWFIDGDGNGNGEYFASMRLNEDGAVAVTVESRFTDPATEICDGDFAMVGSSLSISFNAQCLGEPRAIAVNPGIVYDQRVSDPNGEAAFDQAPDDDDNFSDPVSGPGLVQGVNRLAGAERIATAIAVSQAEFFQDGETETVVLARADLFPDALAGTPLAVQEDAPILLTPSDTLSDLTLAEIDRVTGGAGTVILLGGEVAISSNVQQALDEAGYSTVRYGGTNRFETAVAIATEGLDSPSSVLAADGGDFQDAILAGTAAPTLGGAVLLTDGATVPPATQAYLDANTTDVIAIGDDAAGALPEADAVAGGSPVATSVLVAERFYPNATLAGIARVDVFADALTGGALLANFDGGQGPLLFVESNSLPAEVGEYIEDDSFIDTVVIFGGVDAVNEDVEADLGRAIDRS